VQKYIYLLNCDSVNVSVETTTARRQRHLFHWE